MTPSFEYIIEFVPLPTPIQRFPFQNTVFPAVENNVDPKPVHVIPPFKLYAKVFVPDPAATITLFGNNIEFLLILFHYIELPAVVKIVVPNPSQFIPSIE